MEGRTHYRKLIRDRVPARMEQAGAAYETRVLSEEEYGRELRRKVAEEASAVPNVETREELLDELADLETVIAALKEHEKITEEEMQPVREANMEKKGGFKERIFLEWSSSDGYKSNEQTT